MTAKKKKDGGQRNPIMPRPSYMWIYVLVAAFIIGYSLYGAENTEPVRSDWNTVEGMVRSGDVERIRRSPSSNGCPTRGCSWYSTSVRWMPSARI